MIGQAVNISVTKRGGRQEFARGACYDYILQ